MPSGPAERPPRAAAPGTRRRAYVVPLQRALDVAALASAYFAAFFFRFDGDPPWLMWKIAWITVPYVVLGKYALLSLFGVPQFAWRYIGLREAVRIVESLALASVGLVAIRLLVPFGLGVHPAFRFLVLPLGVLALDAVLAPIAIVGLRTLRRAIVERRELEERADPPMGTVRTLIIGAGEEGVALVRSLAMHPELGVDPVGFVDDDAAKIGSRIHGVRVLGPTSDARTIAARHGIEQAILTVPDQPREQLRELLAAFDGASIPVKVVPSVPAMIGADGATPSLRPVELDDLLRRSSVTISDEPLTALLGGKVVLVTGAGGSIGSELARQIAVYRPSRLVLADRSENALYEIHREVAARIGSVAEPRLLDVTRADRVEELFREISPAVVFHAAAHKHVPLLESQAAEAVRNNLLGTKLVADAACAHGADVFVLVSTDKAVNPSSVMGATKRAAELYLQSIAGHATTRLTAVRFGNVLGSSGSVVPLFREQIRRGGPITVTHPEMRRYFMTIPEASHLVLHAGAIGRGGEIFILDMGEPIRIVDLAEDLIRLSGLVPHRDVKIEFSGTRAGEKLFEELSVDDECAERTSHPKIFTAKVRATGPRPSDAELAALIDAAERLGDEATETKLASVVPEFVRAPATDERR